MASHRAATSCVYAANVVAQTADSLGLVTSYCAAPVQEEPFGEASPPGAERRGLCLSALCTGIRRHYRFPQEVGLDGTYPAPQSKHSLPSLPTSRFPLCPSRMAANAHSSLNSALKMSCAVTCVWEVSQPALFSLTPAAQRRSGESSLAPPLSIFTLKKVMKRH